MVKEVIIRRSSQDDILSLEELYKKSFPDEELFPLVNELLNDEKNVLSLSAIINDVVVGHIAFSKCNIDSKINNLSLLGPLAVLPDFQRKGVASGLIKAGFSILSDSEFFKVLVLGDPNFYKKFGFKVEAKIRTPYSIPKEWESAWQSCMLTDVTENPEGKLEVPIAWRRQELWSS